MPGHRRRAIGRGRVVIAAARADGRDEDGESEKAAGRASNEALKKGTARHRLDPERGMMLGFSC
jgi:hypothetical protein